MLPLRQPGLIPGAACHHVVQEQRLVGSLEGNIHHSALCCRIELTYQVFSGGTAPLSVITQKGRVPSHQISHGVPKQLHINIFIWKNISV